MPSSLGTIEVSPEFVQKRMAIERAKVYRPKAIQHGRDYQRKTPNKPRPKTGSRRNKPKQYRQYRYEQKGSHDRSLKGPLAWKKNELTEAMYVAVLTEEQIQEIEKAMREFIASEQHEGYISQTTFRLPILGPILRQRSNEVHNKHGIVIVRGLVPAHYTPKEFIIIHAGISSWIGSKRGIQTGNASNPEERHVVLHITDHNIQEIRKTDPDRFVAPANTTVSMPFHTDTGDIISLAYRQLSQTGGGVRIASAWTIYNELLKKYPKVIKTMEKPYPWDMVGNIPDRAFHGLLHETVDFCGRQITMMIERRPFYGDEKCQRLKDLPDLTPAQERALRVVQKIAEEVCTPISIEAGDIVFINNRAVLHARSSYVDHSPDPASKRQATRLVIRDAEYGWAIPKVLEPRFKGIYGSTERPEDERWEFRPFAWGTGAQHG
ncbi:hypothetical protein EV426DRAFT_615762 [Tirmania nivea]|nr:hypothetical protein EV426DRAFT_615762 [Tirmania nivea]